MNCLICGLSETIDGLTSVLLERGEARYVVENVPAQVCPRCGEAFVLESIAVQLLQSAEQKIMAGQMMEAWMFGF